MPERAMRRQRRPWWLPYAAAVAVALAVGSGAWALWGDAEADEIVAEEAIRARVEAARDAAARAFFIYPPVNEPDTRTAYAEVVDLETLAGEYGKVATEKAAELRHEFA